MDYKAEIEKLVVEIQKPLYQHRNEMKIQGVCND